MASSKSVHPIDLINSVGAQLMIEFERGGFGATPGLIGEHRENSVRPRIQMLLGELVRVGTGCVIDINGNASKQQDLIISEAAVGPAFSTSENAVSSYYPCETVVATCEVKSTLGKVELNDIIEKSHSVKSLRRQSTSVKNISGKDNYPTRRVGSTQHLVGTPEESFDQDGNYRDQIFTAAVAGKCIMSNDKILEVLSRCSVEKGMLLPGAIATLDGVFISFRRNGKISFTSIECDEVSIAREMDNPFSI